MGADARLSLITGEQGLQRIGSLDAGVQEENRQEAVTLAADLYSKLHTFSFSISFLPLTNLNHRLRLFKLPEG